MTDTETEAFGGYGLAIRTFWIKGTDLKVSRRWTNRESNWDTHDERFSTFISATATSEKDTVRVIGAGDHETTEFHLSIKSDEYAAEEWKLISRLEGAIDGTIPEIRLRARIREMLTENPPTATLFATDDDWEIGIRRGWSMECAVPPSVLAQFGRSASPTHA